MSREIFSFNETGLSKTFVDNIKLAIRQTEEHPLEVPQTIQDLKFKVPYEEGQQIIKNSWHSGQLKLLVGTVKFLNLALAHQTNQQIKYVIYAGAAPGIASALLPKLFPNLLFILIDPSKFHCPAKAIPKNTSDKQAAKYAKTAKPGLLVMQRFMTISLSQAFVDAGIHGSKCLFISDIRTDSGGKSLPDSVDILWNLSQQYNWMCILKPFAAMNKFRHPFYNDADDFPKLSKEEPYAEDFRISKEAGIDFIANFVERKLVYVSGEIHLQVWAPVSSTETRLISFFDGLEPKNTLQDYGTPQEYDAYMCYFNNVLRARFAYNNPYKRPKVGFCECVECSLEASIWENYVIGHLGIDPDAKGQIREHIWKLIDEACNIIKKDRLNESHLMITS